MLIQPVGEHDAEDCRPVRADHDVPQIHPLWFKHGEGLRAVTVSSQLSKRRDVEVEASRRDQDVAGATGLEKDSLRPTVFVG
jgi:hypothetical protein